MTTIIMTKILAKIIVKECCILDFLTEIAVKKYFNMWSIETRIVKISMQDSSRVLKIMNSKDK